MPSEDWPYKGLNTESKPRPSMADHRIEVSSGSNFLAARIWLQLCYGAYVVQCHVYGVAPG